MLDAISLWRTPEEGPADEDSKHLLELLVPHVQTALKVRRTLGVKDQRLACAEAVANACSTATFIVTQRGRIQHCNSTAESLVRSGECLMLQNGCLSARETRANAALLKLFQDAAFASLSVSEPQPSHFLSLARPSGERPLQLIATPLPETHRERSRADLLLLVTDPEKPPNFPDDALRALYDLTSAETEVANGLLMGYSSEEIACRRRVSTGTSRQSDMIRLFMALPQAPMQTV